MLVPFAVVTVTSTVPAEPAGDVALIEVSLFSTVKVACGYSWNFTEVATPVKPVPVSDTRVSAVGWT